MNIILKNGNVICTITENEPGVRLLVHRTMIHYYMKKYGPQHSFLKLRPVFNREFVMKMYIFKISNLNTCFMYLRRIGFI